MEVSVPWREWRRLLRAHDDESSAAVDAIRSFLSASAGCLSAEDVFDALWRVRCGHKAQEGHDIVALMMIVAIEGREERRMAAALLDSVLGDAVEDVRGVSKLAARWSVHEETAEANTIAWGTMVEAAYCICRANASSAVAPEHLLRLQRTLEDNGFGELSDTHDAPRTDGGMTWDEFMEIPSGLGRTPLAVSKTGRETLQYVEEIVAQQEWCLRRRSDENAQAAAVIEEIGSLVQPIVAVWEQARKMDQGRRASQAVDGIIADEVLFETFPRRSESQSDEDESATGAASPTSESTEACIRSTVAELETIEDAAVLSIRVTSLLGLQLRTREYLAVGDQTDDWERAIRKEINSLTASSGGSFSDRTAALLRLAALHPVALIDSLLDSAVSTAQHHKFFARLMSLCPVLARWPALQPTNRQSFNANSEGVVSLRLRDALIDAILPPDSSEPIEKSPAFRFVVTLSGIAKDQTSTSDPVLSPSTVQRQIFLELLDDEAAASDTQVLTRAYTLLYEFIKEVRSAGCPIHSQILTSCLKRAVSAYLLPSTVELQDILLVLIELIHNDHIDADLKKLVATADVRLRSLVESKPVGQDEGTVGSDVDSLLRFIEYQLWSLVWQCGLPDHEETTRGLQQRLIQLQKQQCCLNSGATATGASVIEAQVARMLRSSGRRVAERIMRATEILYLGDGSSHEPTIVSLGSTPDAWCVPLERPLWVMLFAVRCLGIARLDGSSPRSPPHAFDVTMGRVDAAIESSLDDPVALLMCLHTVAFVFSTCGDDIESQRMRTEIATVRVLFLLKEQPSDRIPTDQQKEFRASVAVALVTSGLVKSEAVKRFLQTHAG